MTISDTRSPTIEFTCPLSSCKSFCVSTLLIFERLFSIFASRETISFFISSFASEKSDFIEEISIFFISFFNSSFTSESPFLREDKSIFFISSFNSSFASLIPSIISDSERPTFSSRSTKADLTSSKRANTSSFE